MFNVTSASQKIGTELRLSSKRRFAKMLWFKLFQGFRLAKTEMLKCATLKEFVSIEFQYPEWQPDTKMKSSNQFQILATAVIYRAKYFVQFPKPNQ